MLACLEHIETDGELTARVEMITVTLPSVSAMMCKKMARMFGSAAPLA